MNKLDQAFALFDAYNQRDPSHTNWQNEDYPLEYFYALKLYEWVLRLDPEADEVLQLAARSQHIGRWEIPRDTYPEGRTGYLKWRSDLSKYHAEKAAKIMATVGYDEQTQEKVRTIIQKRRIKADPQVQTMENALCLVFLEYQYEALVQKLDDEKMIPILQKTWAKMSEPGQKLALSLSYSTQGRDLIEKALK